MSVTALLVIWLVALAAFELGISWARTQREAQDALHAAAMWAAVQQRIAQDRAALDGAEAEARRLPESLRRREHATRN